MLILLPDEGTRRWPVPRAHFSSMFATSARLDGRISSLLMGATAPGKNDGCVLKKLSRKGHLKSLRGQARLITVLQSWWPTSTQWPGTCRASVRLYNK